MKTETKTIALGNIAEAPWNPRGEITEKSVKELAQTMKENGLSTPITLGRVKEDGKTYLIAGHRRLAAARLLGWKSIPYTLTEYETIAAAKMATFNDNDQHVEIDPFAKCRQIVAMLDAGVSVNDVSRRMARSPKWVERCRPIVEIVDANDGIGDKMTVGTIAQIAAMPEKVRGKLVKCALNRAGCCYGRKVSPSDIRWDIQREQHNLDEAKFNTKPCKRCEKRTGAQPDLWGETDGKLGYCNDCACFREKVKAYEDALIAEATQGAKEVERVEGSWGVPDEADADKPTKKKQTAYVYLDDGAAVVKYGPSRAAIDAARAKEREEYEAANAEKNAEGERNRVIKDKFIDTMQSEERDEDVRKAIGAVIGKREADEGQREWIIDLIASNWADLWNGEDIADVLRVFPFTRELCGIGDEDAEWFIERHAPKDEDDE